MRNVVPFTTVVDAIVAAATTRGDDEATKLEFAPGNADACARESNREICLLSSTRAFGYRNGAPLPRDAATATRARIPWKRPPRARASIARVRSGRYRHGNPWSS